MICNCVAHHHNLSRGNVVQKKYEDIALTGEKCEKDFFVQYEGKIIFVAPCDTNDSVSELLDKHSEVCLALIRKEKKQ